MRHSFESLYIFVFCVLLVRSSFVRLHIMYYCEQAIYSIHLNTMQCQSQFRVKSCSSYIVSFVYIRRVLCCIFSEFCDDPDAHTHTQTHMRLGWKTAIPKCVLYLPMRVFICFSIYRHTHRSRNIYFRRVSKLNFYCCCLMDKIPAASQRS